VAWSALVIDLLHRVHWHPLTWIWNKIKTGNTWSKNILWKANFSVEEGREHWGINKSLQNYSTSKGFILGSEEYPTDQITMQPLMGFRYLTEKCWYYTPVPVVRGDAYGSATEEACIIFIGEKSWLKKYNLDFSTNSKRARKRRRRRWTKLLSWVVAEAITGQAGLRSG